MTAHASMADRLTRLKKAFGIFARPKIGLMLILGFSAGLPFLLYFSTLSVRLEKSGTDAALIGFFSWFGLSYSCKFLWAPVVDKFLPPVIGKVFGKRAAWIFVTQIFVALGLIGLGFADPVQSLSAVALFSFLTAFSSATQDICIDAWRIEAADGDDEQAPLAAAYQYGYRTAMIVSGGAALTIAGLANWTAAYCAMAAFMLLGAAILILWPRPGVSLSWSARFACLLPGVGLAVGLFCLVAVVGIVVGSLAATLFEHLSMTRGSIARMAGFVALSPFIVSICLIPWIRGFSSGDRRLTHPVTGPVFDLFWRYGWMALAVLAFTATYRLSDIVMGVMAKASYSHIGYDETAIGLVSGIYGPWPVFVGVALASLFSLAIGLRRALFVGAVASMIGNVAFVWLMGQSALTVFPLFAAVTIDNVAGGFAGTVFVAYLSTMTRRTFSASQYALFSSMYSLVPKLLAGSSGVIVEDVGYAMFFLYAAALGLPAVFLSLFVGRMRPDRQ